MNPQLTESTSNTDEITLEIQNRIAALMSQTALNWTSLQRAYGNLPSSMKLVNLQLKYIIMSSLDRSLFETEYQAILDNETKIHERIEAYYKRLYINNRSNNCLDRDVAQECDIPRNLYLETSPDEILAHKIKEFTSKEAGAFIFSTKFSMLVQCHYNGYPACYKFLLLYIVQDT